LEDVLIPRRRLLKLGILGLALVGARQVWLLLGGFDRRRFEAIVEEARGRDIAPGETVALRVRPFSSQLVETDARLERGDGAGRVWASRTKDGRLKVVIETRDLGHTGQYGFAYSDVQLTPQRLDENWSTIDVPSKLQIVDADAKIDEHWWRVLNNLD
jgi:hypothetical protein